MQASQLQLEHYYLDELHFALTEKYGPETIDSEVPLRSEDVNVKVEAGQNPDNELEWIFRLNITLDDKESKFPYEFIIRLTGFFNVSEDCEPKMREQLATINGPSILFSAAREILATVSARSRFVSIFLPPVRFFGMTKKEPEPESAGPKGLPASEAEARPKKRKARKAVAKKR